MTFIQRKSYKYWIQILEETNQEANVMTKHGLTFENQLSSLMKNELKIKIVDNHFDHCH